MTKSGYNSYTIAILQLHGLMYNYHRASSMRIVQIQPFSYLQGSPLLSKIVLNLLSISSKEK